ncbi:MAG: hypothetical protein IPH13_00725 [Planctomycetes bacterium]|nr:hypothetical protein [Planctomycetota bacterium]MCC7170599.1 hypothetical protein [Planctomycetota bacterium]
MLPRVLLGCACAVAILAGVPAAFAQSGGDVWFPTTTFGGGQLVRVDRDGVVHTYNGIQASSFAIDVQGKLYAADTNHDEIAIVTQAGKVGSIAWTDPQSLRACADGSLWVRSVASGGKTPYWRIDAAGTVLAGPALVPTAPVEEVVDASGALWALPYFDTSTVYRIDQNGTITTIAIPFASPSFVTLSVAAMSDGTMWAANGTNTIRRLNASFQVISSITTSAPMNLVSPGRAKTLVTYSATTRRVYAIGSNGVELRSFALPWPNSTSVTVNGVREAPDGSFWVDGTKGIFQFAADRFDVHGNVLGSYGGAGSGLAQGDVTGRLILELAPSSADLDGDGVSNRVEVVVGSNPLDVASVPAAMTAVSSGTPGAGSVSIQIHAPASSNQPYFVALSLLGRGGVKLDPPYATPSVPLGLDAWLALSLRAPPLAPTLGGVLDANGDASTVTPFGSVLSGMTVYLSAIYATDSDVPAATAHVAVTLP